jgi:hypothetical protein
MFQLLNTSYGKFVERCNQGSTTFFNSVQMTELHELLLDPTKHVKDFEILGPNKIMIEYNNQKEFQREIHFVNPAIGGFVTSYGRLRLYDVLESLGEKCFYTDTDSAIWVGGPNIQESVQTGHYLGDLESELPQEDYITKYVSLGCKTYAYVTAKGKKVVKAKGFSLKNIDVNFDTMAEIIDREQESQLKINSPAKQNFKTFPQFQIRREKKTQALFNITMKKDLKFTFDKRVLDYNSLTTKPYGHL